MKRPGKQQGKGHSDGLNAGLVDAQGAGGVKRRGKVLNRRPRPDPSWGSRLDLADLSEADDGSGASGYAWAGLDGPTGKGKDQRNARAGLRPGARGWMGRGRGQALVVQTAPEFRATTSQVCGLWPWAVGAGAPVVGVPLGHHLGTGATVCADPISWFQMSHLIANPSVFVLGLPALGKSTLVRRMVTGLAGFGVMPLVLGDLKPDYVHLIRALGGQVVQLGHGRGYLNVLDPGGARDAADRLIAAGRRDLADEVLGDAHSRRHAMVAALITILRREPPTDREESILDRALRVLDEQHEQRRHAPGADRSAPVLGDLLKVVQAGPEQVRAVAVDRGDDTRYKAITENLEASLISLVNGGRLGETFSRPTSEPMRHDAPVVFDVSAIDDNESDLQAAALMACWSNGFGTVNVAHALADAGLEPARQYFVVLDELWRALRSGRGMVDRVDALTRLNRGKGVGQAMVSHTMSDLEALTSEEDKAKARGFVERAGMVICAGLPEGEMPKLTRVVALSQAEQDMLASWTSPPSWDQAQGREGAPPGRGKFLIKVGGKPGIPLQVQLTSVETGDAGVHDTNVRWREVSRRGAPRQQRPLAGQVPLVEAVAPEVVVETLRQVLPDPLATADSPAEQPAKVSAEIAVQMPVQMPVEYPGDHSGTFTGVSEMHQDADPQDVGVVDDLDRGEVTYAPLPPQAAAWLSDPSSVLPTARTGRDS